MQDDQPSKPKRTLRAGTKLAVIPQERDRSLFKVISLLRIIDREQAQKIAGFNSVTRANTRLLKLTKAGLLKRFFFVSALGGKKAIYCLSKAGAELFGVEPNSIERPADSFLIGDRFVAHQLAINEIYCSSSIRTHSTDPKTSGWRFFQSPISQAIPLSPDAFFEFESNSFIRSMFLEVDRGTEGLTVWNDKIKNYLNLATSGGFEQLFQRSRFSVLVVTTSQVRMHSLRFHVRKITSKLFYFTTLEAITEQGFWHSIWLRPEGDQLQPLT